MVRALAATFVMLALGAACSSTEPLAAAEVLNHRNCKTAEPGVRPVTYPEVAELRGSTLLALEAPEAPAGAPDLLLLAVSRGPQATPGYHFELADAYLDAGVAVVELDWATPEPDAILPQVMTHPCIVVGLEAGPFTRVRVVADAEVLGELAL